MKISRGSAFFLLVLVSLLLADASYAAKKAVATFLPVFVFAANVAGDRVELSLLVPPDTDVHEFSLRPLDIQALYEADLVFMNGATLEGGLLRGAPVAGKLVDTSRGVELISLAEGRATDPHVWLDPLIAARQVDSIKDALSGIDPGNAGYYEERAEAYKKKLASLHRDIEAGLAALAGKDLITYHESFNYFARRYGLRPVSLTGPGAEHVLPQRVREVYDIVRDRGVGAVFREKQFPGRGLDALRRDLGISICALDTIETGRAEEGYYEEAMRGNLAEIIRCLGR